MRPHAERLADYLEHILDALQRIQRYTSGKSRDDFATDTLLQDGVLRNLSIVGEAAHRILIAAPGFAAQHPEIPLAKIYGTRNRLTHAYEEVDLDIVWNLVQQDVPSLQEKVACVLRTLPHDSSGQ